MSMSPAEVLAILRLLIAALGRVFNDPNEMLEFDGVRTLVTDIVTRFQAHVKVYKDVDDAEETWKTKLGIRTPLEPTVREDIVALHAAVIGKLGLRSQLLKEFGIDPKKDRKLSAVESLARSEKAKATRKKNGTMGKRQRKTANQNPPPKA